MNQPLKWTIGSIGVGVLLIGALASVSMWWNKPTATSVAQAVEEPAAANTTARQVCNTGVPSELPVIGQPVRLLRRTIEDYVPADQAMKYGAVGKTQPRP